MRNGDEAETSDTGKEEREGVATADTEVQSFDARKGSGVELSLVPDCWKADLQSE
jgi:hypothetical protein